MVRTEPQEQKELLDLQAGRGKVGKMVKTEKKELRELLVWREDPGLLAEIGHPLLQLQLLQQ